METENTRLKLSDYYFGNYNSDWDSIYTHINYLAQCNQDEAFSKSKSN